MREKIVRELSPWLALVTCIAVGGAAAAGYGLTSPHRYRATAQLLVAPVKPSDSTFVGIDVLRDTGGKRTAAASVAALLRAPQIVDAVRAQLALKRSSQSLLDAVDAHVVAGSDVVAVTAEDTSPNGAAQLANTFVHALVSQRNAIFQSQLANAIRRDEQLVSGGAGSRVKTRLATLQALLAQPDPTVTVVSEAAPPTSASWPDRPRLVSAGAGIGAAVGALVALTLFLLRRQGRVAGGQYHREVSDGTLEKLVDRLESRIAARESALSARERDLRATLGEVKAAQAGGPDVDDLLRREAELESRLGAAGVREAELEKRVEALTKREVELARRAAQLAVAERELAERAKAAKDQAAREKSEREKAERERAKREQAERKEAAREQAGREKAAREQAGREKAEREKAERELAKRPEPEPEPVAQLEPQPEPEPVRAAPAPAPVFAVDGHYNLLALERLVEEHRREFPEKAEEWASYLFFLREHAASDGRVPSSFDALIQDTFAELVG